MISGHRQNQRSKSLAQRRCWNLLCSASPINPFLSSDSESQGISYASASVSHQCIDVYNFLLKLKSIRETLIHLKTPFQFSVLQTE